MIRYLLAALGALSAIALILRGAADNGGSRLPSPGSSSGSGSGSGSSSGSGKPSGSGSSSGSGIVSIARSKLGKPYSGVNPQGPNHYDCSGLVQYCYSELGKSIPRQVTEQAEQAPISIDARSFATIDEMKAALSPGMCLGTGEQSNGRYKHTGIWSGSSVIHASASRGAVVEDPGLGSYWFNERRKLYKWI